MRLLAELRTSWAAMPVGALVTGLLVEGFGVVSGLVARGWGQLDRSRPAVPEAATVAP